MAPCSNNSKLLDKKATKRKQYIAVIMIYYSRSVHPPILRAINELSRVQKRPTRDTEEKSKTLLEYAATYPNTTIRYRSRDMVLHFDLDTAYITIPEARSCYSGHLYLSNWTSPKTMKNNLKRNVPIHIECKTIQYVVSSAAEAEICGNFNN